MVVHLVRDLGDIRRLLDARLARDPVSGTILGTIRVALDRDAGDPWCATNGEGGLAVRSQREYPVVLDGTWPDVDRADLVTALASVPGLAGVSGVTGLVDPVAHALAEPADVLAMRLYRLATLTPAAGVEGTARRAQAPDRDLLLEWYRSFGAEAHGRMPDLEHLLDQALANGGCWLWLDARGTPVSLATRQPVVVGSARVGPVYTPPGQRGRSYGSAVTAAATRDILADGAVPVLFADVANPTSNRIYEALGFELVDERKEHRFSPSATAPETVPR